MTFAEALSTPVKRPSRSVREFEILRISSQIGGDDFLSSTDDARNAALNWAQQRAGEKFPKEAWDYLGFELPIGGRNCAAVRFRKDLVDLWALRIEDPDKEVAGRTWSTEIVVGGRAGERPHLSLRLIVNTREAAVDIEPHVPGMLLQMVEMPTLLQSGRTLRSTPVNLVTENDAEDLCDYIEDSDRRLPIFVVTLPENGKNVPLILADEVARATTGIAHVYQLPAKLTWAITKRFGKYLSVFDGAVRAYLPGFSPVDDPHRHRLFVASRLQDPKGALACKAWLRQIAASQSISNHRLGQGVLEFASIRSASRQTHADDLKARHAPDAELLVSTRALNESLAQELDEKKREISDYLDLAEAAEERAQIAEQDNRSLLERVRQLQRALAGSTGSQSEQLPIPQRWSDLQDWLDRSYPDRVVLTPAAKRMARDPEFEDVAKVARAIKWLATDYHSRRTLGGGSVRDENIEPGVINAYCGGDTYKTEWQGRRYEVDQHVKNGGTTHDPKRCLRIYYFWNEDEQRVVIDHLPSHRRTSAT